MRGFGQMQIVSTAPTPVPTVDPIMAVLNFPAQLAYKIYPWKVTDMIDAPTIIINAATWGLLLYLLVRK